MCGINGVFKYQRLDLDKILKMNSVTSKRGPDFDSIYHDSDVIFGHNRLAIIDPDVKSNQPFISNDKSIVLTYNGELYNYLDLRKQLEKHYDFITNSDTEVVVAAYQHWGIKMLDYFNGMFAFALWDKHNNQFFLSRDRLGIKPLYFTENNQSVVFSSSLIALNSYVESDSEIVKPDLYDYLSYGTVHSPNTILNDIKLLPSGSYYNAGPEESSIVEYWSFFNSRAIPLSYLKTIEKTKNLIFEAVEKRLVSDVPFGVFLSGGIDSSILVATASELSHKTINTFSIVFGEKEFDERKYSRLIANKYETNHNEINIHPDDLLNNIGAPFLNMDHPTIDGINTYFISKAVSEKGYKMAISGAGADELFAGYPVFKQSASLNNKKWMYSFPPQLRNTFGKLLKWYDPSIKTEKKVDILNQRLLELSYTYQLFISVFSKISIDILLNNKTNDFKLFPMLWGINEIEPGNRGSNFPFLSKVSCLEIETYLQNVLLRDADQMGMANSLEIRVPFLDHELVEFILSVNDNYKIGDYPKNLLVDAIKGWLPEEVINRKKMGFVFPWDRWMKNELHDFCYDSLQNLEESKTFNMGAVLDLWYAFLKGESRTNWVNIWTLVVLGKWTSINKISFLND
jgi:asparagine synthase (glutamine-hydrolysing)